MYRGRMNAITRIIGRLRDARVFYIGVVPVFVGNRQNITEYSSLWLLIVSLRRFGKIRPVAIPAGANARIDRHLVLDTRGAALSGLENCRKIAAKSNILFLSVVTVGMFMRFYRLCCQSSFLDGCYEPRNTRINVHLDGMIMILH